MLSPSQLRGLAAACTLCWMLSIGGLPSAAAQEVKPHETPSIVHRVESGNRVEMVVNSSRILTMERKFTQVEVNNPDLLEVTPRSPTQVQIFAKHPGVTQLNVWDEDDAIHTLDVVVYADARELSMVLQTQFPTASLRVTPLANSVIISGFVDNPDYVARIIEIAEDFHPKVINNLRVGGVQQVLLHVKAMEVSRTKLRDMGFDFGVFSGDDFVGTSVSGALSKAVTATSGAAPVGTMSLAGGGGTLSFGVLDGANGFIGAVHALRQNNLAKILAEPTLVTVSGRPAFFNVGGEFPILVPQSLGTVSIEYKRFGTQVDFVPIVLGNGYIRLEVRPRVSEIDDTRSVIIRDINVPALRVREADTGVEMRAGQTLALCGLVQNRVEAEMRGIPLLSDIPFIGAAFRRVKEQNNEVELLILVTPQLVDGMDCHDVPPGGPGLMTCSPDDCQLYWKGHLEVPCYPEHGCPTDCLDGHPGAMIPHGPLPPGAMPEEGRPIPALPPAEEVPAVPPPPPSTSTSIPADIHPPVTSRRGGSGDTSAAGPPSRYDRHSWSDGPSLAGGNTAAETPGLIGPIGYDVKD